MSRQKLAVTITSEILRGAYQGPGGFRIVACPPRAYARSDSSPGWVLVHAAVRLDEAVATVKEAVSIVRYLDSTAA
jgi:hypothetical protein